MSAPEVSVVMSVFNGADALPATLESVLSQQGCDFEFIVIDDGSTDGSGQLLDQWAARDARMRVIHQDNTGLTRALIHACGEARGEFIARQDCGDVSLPGRLTAQVQCLRMDPAAVAASCHTEVVGPKSEPLYQIRKSKREVEEGLANVQGDMFGPHHGSVMMRTDAYHGVGGYRRAFYFSQDLDLWTRLVERGHFCVADEVLYQARLTPNSISGAYSAEQRRLASLIAQASIARRAGGDESPFVREAATIIPASKQRHAARLAQGNYFIGSCLRKTSSKSAYEYFLAAVRCNPWYWRAWVRLLQTAIGH